MMTEKEARKQEIAKKMKESRVKSGLTQLQVAEKLGITYQAISNYERGKNSIETNVLISMCDIYNVDPIEILGSDPKAEIYNVLYSEQASFDEKCAAALGLFRIYFSRSVGQKNFRFEHPDFDEYVAMLLNQNQFKERFGPKIYDALVQKYGKAAGIPEGHTSYKIDTEIHGLQKKQKTSSTVKTASENLSKVEQKHMQKYRLLDPYGKEAVDSILDIEHRRCETERQTKATQRDQRMRTEASDELAITRIVEKIVYVNPAAAGTPLYAESDFERLEFPEDEVPRGADFGIRISGRSMEPTVMNGAIAWIRKTINLLDGTVGVFMLNDSAVCKRFFKESDGTIRLESDNPEFDPVSVTEFDSFLLVGEVIGTA